MKLGDILRNSRALQPINPKPCKFLANAQDPDFKPVKVEVNAVLLFVSEDRRQELLVAAHADVKKRFPGQTVPDGIISDEEAYHVLAEALRDAEPNESGIHEKLAKTVQELRGVLVLREAQRLMNDYTTWLREEFPTSIDDAEFAKLVEEAKKNSLSDLLTSCGYEKLVVLASFLAGRSTR